MKKLIPILLAVFAFAFVACEKEPDTGKLENGTIVMTEYQQGTNFSSFSTFFVPDSVLEINAAKGDTTFVANDYAKSVIASFVVNMTNRGFLYTQDKSNADLGIQLSYIKDVYYLTTWGSPWSYRGYWWPGYWNGSWGGYRWYYPYTITYSYNVGSIIADMVNLNGATTNGQLPIIWNAYISGLLGPNGGINISKAQTGITQAFNQSTYLKK